MRIQKRTLSLLLAVIMLFSVLPVSALAEGETEPAAEPAAEQIAEQTEQAPAEQTEEPAGEIPAAPAEQPETEETELQPSEPAAEPLPGNMPGLPEGYVLSEEELAAKAALNENGILENLEKMTAGVDYVEDELFFTADSAEKAAVYAAAYGAELVNYEYCIAVIKLSGVSVLDAVKAAADPDTLLPAAEPNYTTSLIPVDESLDEANLDSSAKASVVQQTWYSWYTSHGNRDPFLSNPSSSNYQYMHEVINTYGAWGITTGSSAIKVAVIDTGINSSHTEFSGEYIPTDYYSSYGTAVDGHGHGTHCAGIIAANMNNGNGGSGIAPDVSLMAYKALGDNGGGSDAAVCQGIYWAAINDADIISMSLGSYGYSPNEYNAIKYAISRGCTIVAAMGNDGSNICSYPAAYNIPGIIAVGATDRGNSRAYYSNYGTWEDILAPGSSIYSTSHSSNNGYVYMSGTSMATPVVAGVCALYASRFGHLKVTPANMEKTIKAGKTNGIIDAWKIVSKGYKGLTGFNVKSILSDETNYCLANGEVPQNFAVQLTAEEGQRVIYTLDGTYPCTENGQVINGIVYDGSIDLTQYAVGEELTLTAMSIADDGTMGDVETHTFTVAEPADVATLKLEGAEKLGSDGKLSLKAVNFKGETLTEGVKWSVILPEDADASLKAEVSSDGVLTAESGKAATVTVRAETADGMSGERRVEVTGLSFSSASIVGPSTLLIGKSGSYKLYVNGKAVSAYWYVQDSTGYNVSNGYIKVSSSGSVSVNKNASSNNNGTAVTLTAVAKNGTGQASIKIPVNYPVTAVNFTVNENYGYSYTRDRKGNLTGITLYCQSSSPIYPDRAHTYLTKITEGNPYAAVEYSSSKTSVATVTQSGEICAVGAGKATIKVMATDGTKKSKSITVTVVNPASRIGINTTVKTMNGVSNDDGSIDVGAYYLAVGKSATLKAVLGDDYGKPSSTKVQWQAYMYRLDKSGNITATYDTSSGYFSMSSSGVLSVKKTAKNAPGFSSYRHVIEVHAMTTDGTSLDSECLSFYVATPVTKIYYYDYPYYYIGATWTCSTDSGFSFNYRMISDSIVYNDAVIVTSSNPAVAGAKQNSSYYNKIDVITGSKKGTAVITVKAADGSGKTMKVTVKVK